MSKNPLISKPMFEANQRKTAFQLSRMNHVNVNHRTETIQDNFRMERLYHFSDIKLFYILLLFREDNRVYNKIHLFTPQSAPSARLVDLLRSSGFGLPAGGREGVEPLEGAWQVQVVLLPCRMPMEVFKGKFIYKFMVYLGFVYGMGKHGRRVAIIFLKENSCLQNYKPYLLDS